jgi:uncharacterized protein YbjT (DUF2867 family)
MQHLVTVFGGSGFVGAQVVRALAKKGLRVRVAVRQPGRGYKLRMLGDVGQIEVVQANIRRPETLARAVEGAFAVVNAVGQAHETGAQSFAGVHVEGARAVAQAARAAGVGRFVQLSGIGSDPGADTPYARARGEGEAAVREVFPTAVMIRPSAVFGQGDVFFNRLGEIASMSPIMPLIGGGKARIQPVFVGDVAAAVAAALTDPKAAGQTYELGGPTIYTFEEITRLVLSETMRKRPLVPLPIAIANFIGQMGEVVGKVLPVAPPITRDQVALLTSDNLVTPGALTLADLGVQPTALEPIVRTYLYRYRKGGQFAELAPQEA